MLHIYIYEKLLNWFNVQSGRDIIITLSASEPWTHTMFATCAHGEPTNKRMNKSAFLAMCSVERYNWLWLPVVCEYSTVKS